MLTTPTFSQVAYVNSTLPMCPVTDFSYGTIPSVVPTVEGKIDALEMQRRLLLATGGPSREKFLALDNLEREIAWLEDEERLATAYRPPPSSRVYENKGWGKDFWNAFGTGLWTYKDDPRSIPGVRYLDDLKDDLEDGHYAYAYRVADNRIAVYYTGTDHNTNNAVAHSYLASGKQVYVAGMMEVKAGKLKRADTASGHYLPDPKIEMNPESCETSVTSMESLEILRDKLADDGFDTDALELSPFSHPRLVKDQMDCQMDRNKRQGLFL